MTSPLPRWLTAHAPAREAEEFETYAHLTPVERWLELMALLRLTGVLLEANDRAAEAMAYQEPRSTDSLALWQRLMRWKHDA